MSTKETRQNTKQKIYQFVYDAITNEFKDLTKINASTRNQFVVRAKNFIVAYKNVDDFLKAAEKVFQDGFYSLEWHTTRSFLHILRLLVRLHYEQLDKSIGDMIIDLAEDFDVETQDRRKEIHHAETVVDKETFLQKAQEVFMENKMTLRMYCLILIYSEIPLRDDLQVTWQQSIDDHNEKTNYMTSNGSTVWLHIIKSKTIPKIYKARTYSLSEPTSLRILQFVKENGIDDGEFVFGRNKLSDDIKDILARMDIKAPGGGINYIRRMHRSSAVASGNRVYIAAVRRASAHSALSAQGYTSQLKKKKNEYMQWGESVYDRAQYQGSGFQQRPIYFS